MAIIASIKISGPSLVLEFMELNPFLFEDFFVDFDFGVHGIESVPFQLFQY